MTGALTGWLDVTSPISQARRVPTVTVALRHPGKGRHALEILVYASLAAQLGWQGGVHVRVLVSPDQRRLALRPDESGKKLRDRSGSLAMSHCLEWLLRRAPRPATPVPHEVLDGALLLDLPEWAWPEGTPAPAPQVTELTVTVAERNALAEQIAAKIMERPAEPPPVARGGPQPSKLTPAREALFRRLWPDPANTPGAVLRALNALPGERYDSTQAMYYIAKRLGLPTQRSLPADDAAAPTAAAAEDAAPPPPAPPPPLAPPPRIATALPAPAEDEDEREIEALIRHDPGKHGARWVAEEYGWTLERAQQVVFRVRDAMRAEAAAAAEGAAA